jgi:hypothetical protein
MCSLLRLVLCPEPSNSNNFRNVNNNGNSNNNNANNSNGVVFGFRARG